MWVECEQHWTTKTFFLLLKKTPVSVLPLSLPIQTKTFSSLYWSRWERKGKAKMSPEVQTEGILKSTLIVCRPVFYNRKMACRYGSSGVWPVLRLLVSTTHNDLKWKVWRGEEKTKRYFTDKVGEEKNDEK